MGICPCCGQPLLPLPRFVDRTCKFVTNRTSIRFPPSEYQVFRRLFERMNGVVGREELMYAIYGDRYDEDPHWRIIDTYLREIRKRLEPTPYRIENVWGTGWRLVEDDGTKTI